MSGVAWTVTLGDVLIALGIVLLLFEVIKGARPGAKYLTDHLLSLVVFAGAAAEFVMLPQFGTSTYFLLTLLALVDFLSGIALARTAAQPARSPNRRSRCLKPQQPEPAIDPATGICRGRSVSAPSACRRPRSRDRRRIDAERAHRNR